jgi:zinc transport system substrate-binding protein
MKKYIALFTTVLIFFSCVPKSDRKNDDRRNVLTVTIPPQQFFLDRIVGDAFAINVLIPSGMNHETYDPAPSAMVALSRSAIYFKVGDLGFENVWTGRLAKNNPNVIIIDCSAGIELIDGHACCAHHDHNHSHGAMDPHVWTSPSAARVIAKNMLDAVSNLDSENADFYHANFEKLIEKINQTDETIQDLLKDIPSKSFIIYHPALGYFANEYDIHQLSIEFEGKNPSPAQMRNLVDTAKKEEIKTVFIQKGFDEKNAEVIAREIGATVYEINPLAYEWDTELIRIASILAGKYGR